MKNIIKIFVEIYVLDMEGRRGEWKVTDETYEEAVKTIDNWVDAVRMVEKTFNPDTFEITEREVKATHKIYVHGWWKGDTEEIVR